MSADVALAEGDSPNTRSLFLKLPGELRNRIYNFAVEDEGPIFLRHVESKQHTQGEDLVRQDISGFYCEECATEDLLSQTVWRSYYGLTQVCRQIRGEYLPLHRARTAVHIYIYDVYKYLDMLVGSCGGHVGEVLGNIVVCGTTCGRGHSRTLELFLLMKLDMKAPRLSLSSIIEPCEDTEDDEYECFLKGLLNPLLRDR